MKKKNKNIKKTLDIKKHLKKEKNSKNAVLQHPLDALVYLKILNKIILGIITPMFGGSFLAFFVY